MNPLPTTLLVGNHLSGAGVNPSVCESLAVRLRERGWRVLVTSRNPGRVARLHDMLATVWNARHDYDVAHVDVYSGKAFVWADAVCSLLRVLSKPYAVTLRGGGLARFAQRHPRRVARLLRGAAAVTTPSRFLFEHFGAIDPGHLGAQGSCFPFLRGSTEPPTHRSTARSTALYLIPNPIETAVYTFRPRAAVQPHLVWMRAFHPIYEPELAVQALDDLVGEFPQARLTMIGPDKGGGSLQRTRRLVENRNLAGRAVFHGAASKNALPELLDGGDIFLNTSRIDNTPVSVLEAMAAGLCIVSTNAGGLPYLLRDGHDSLLTRCGHAAEMAASIRRVLRDPGLAGRLSRNARRKAEAHDWSAVLPLWERLLLAAAQSAQRTAGETYQLRPRRAI
jgi:glycosyltransferase involved in cell wall biosynthesis